jgi:putative membrane protein
MLVCAHPAAGNKRRHDTTATHPIRRDPIGFSFIFGTKERLDTDTAEQVVAFDLLLFAGPLSASSSTRSIPSDRAGMIITIFVLIFIFVWLMRWSFGGRHHRRDRSESALDVLDGRFARGEIDRAEYEERRKILSR